MNSSKNIAANRLVCILLLTVCSARTNAQKLPSVQNTGFLAPGIIKIDGKANDWNNEFRANNKHNNICYTIANNQTNLYLIVQTADKSTIKKIVGNGIALIIAPAKKQLDNALTVTFPAYNKSEHHGSLLQDTKPDVNDTLSLRLFLDSVMTAVNQKIDGTFKFISITGITAIPDSLISVYNQDGVKAAARVDHKLAYTYELAIPLKYLKEHLTSDQFSYDIRINGLETHENLKIIHAQRGDVLTFESGGKSYMIGYTSSPDAMFNAYSTDFWGEYNIISK